MSKKNTAVTTTATGSNLPAIGNFGNRAGAGKAKIKDRVRISHLIVLNDLSPAVKDELPGAKPGALLHTGTKEIYPRGTRLMGVPVGYEVAYVEKTPRQKGQKPQFVKRHRLNSPIVTQAIIAAKQTDEPWKTIVTDGEGKGNDLFETHYVMWLLVDEFTNPTPIGTVVTAFAKTKIAKWDDYCTMIDGFKGAADVPLYANVATIGTEMLTGSGNSWWVFDIQPAVELEGQGPSASHSVCDPENERWAAILDSAEELFKKQEAGKVDLDEDHHDEGGKAVDDSDPF
jgi:hypothetical protein